MKSVRLARVMSTLLILILLVFVGCQRPEPAGESAGADVQISLQPMPQDEILVVILTDASDAPITDATVALEGNMNHAGMVPVLADPLADDADGVADGHYHLPFTFTMLGDWIITVTVTRDDGSSLRRNLDVRAASDGIKGDHVMPADGESSLPSHSTLAIHNAMARPAPLAGGTGAIYFTLHNDTDTAVTLVGAESPAAGAVEIHTTINDNGVMRMRQITEGTEIAPGDSLELTPGAMHLMLIDLVAPLAEGDSVEVTLHFDEADDLVFTAPVASMDGLPADGEAEHDH